MKRQCVFVPGVYYHLYNRGVQKSDIFQATADWERFLCLLFVCNTDAPVHMWTTNWREIFLEERHNPLVSIGAYCLMKNHFHILVRERVEHGISTFMKKVATAYSMYFNNKYKRTGTLFEGRFKAKHVDTDEYLLQLFGYIHLNPVRYIDPQWKERGIQDVGAAIAYLDGYRYSSYADYRGEHRSEKKILQPEEFPQYFQEEKQFSDFIHAYFE